MYTRTRSSMRNQYEFSKWSASARPLFTKSTPRNAIPEISRRRWTIGNETLTKRKRRTHDYMCGVRVWVYVWGRCTPAVHPNIEDDREKFVFAHSTWVTWKSSHSFSLEFISATGDDATRAAPVNPSSCRQRSMVPIENMAARSSCLQHAEENASGINSARSASILSSYPVSGVASPYVAVRKQALWRNSPNS